MSDEKLHEVEIALTKVEASDKSAHKRMNGLERDVESIGQKVQANMESISKTNILIENLTKTVSEIQESVKSINQLACSVHEIANEMKAMRVDINKVDDYNKTISSRVKIIEDKPAKRYETIAEKIILLVVGGVVSYFLLQMGM